MKEWLDERFGTTEKWDKFANHQVPRHALNPIYCFGGLTFMSFLILAITGIFLATYYQPTPATAHSSVEFIMNEVRFGAVVRSIHHWTANLMIVLIIVHMIRVFYTGSFKKPRELNWVVGVLLFIVTLGFGFTGYILPWDQVGYWASTVGTEIAGGVPFVGKYVMVLLRGGLKISDHTLTRFFISHVVILPIIIVILMVFHFIMIRVQGISDEL